MEVDEEQDSSEPRPQYETTRQGLVFCIDATEKMFAGEDETGKCYLQRCFKCVWDRLMDNIMVSDKEFVGVLLMGATKVGTPAAANPGGLLDGLQDSRNLAIMFDVLRPNTEILKKLDTYIKAEDFADVFKNSYNIKPDFQLSDGIWTAQSMLLSSSIKFGAKELFLMTCDDMAELPVETRRQACKRAETVMRSGISMRLLYLGEHFQVEPFFKEFLVAAHPNIKTNFEDSDGEKFAASNLDLVPDAALTRSCFNRHLFRIDWNLGEGCNITVNFYSLFRKMLAYERKKIVKMEKRANVQIRTNTKKFDADTAALVKMENLYKGVQLEEGAAFFTSKELRELRNIYPVGLFLLGFKPLADIQLFHIRPSWLLQPSDLERPGSSQLFHALLQACLELEVVALCRLVLRSDSQARLVFLLPQAQGPEGQGLLGTACFHLIFEPFSGECRSYGPEQTVRCAEDEKEVAIKVVKKLRVAFQHSFFQNVQLQTYFRAIEALALDYEEPEPVVDSIEPDQALMDKRIGALATTFWERVAANLEEEEEVTSSSSQTSKSTRGRGRGRGRGQNTS